MDKKSWFNKKLWPKTTKQTNFTDFKLRALLVYEDIYS